MHKHDQYVELLFEQLKDTDAYDTIYRGLPLYSTKGRLVGEIDLLAVNKYAVDIFEVKCSFRPVKAKKQLERIVKVFDCKDDQDVSTWFYCGEAEKLVKIAK
jgi:hypothetical protein